MPIEKALFRRVMGSFAAGVTVVTTCDRQNRPYGLTATAFSSVSLLPPLALVCVDKQAESYRVFEESGVFAVNFLAGGQEELSGRFAVSGGEKFRGLQWSAGELGAPLLAGTIGRVECRIVHAYDGGDHTIFVGQIESADANEGAPLVYFRGAYRRLSDAG